MFQAGVHVYFMEVKPALKGMIMIWGNSWSFWILSYNKAKQYAWEFWLNPCNRKKGKIICWFLLVVATTSNELIDWNAHGSI